MRAARAACREDVLSPWLELARQPDKEVERIRRQDALDALDTRSNDSTAERRRCRGSSLAHPRHVHGVDAPTSRVLLDQHTASVAVFQRLR